MKRREMLKSKVSPAYKSLICHESQPLPQFCLATNCTKAFVIIISQVKRMTAKSSLRSTTVFRLGAQSNKCEGRQTTRRLGRDNTHYGSRAGAPRNCVTQLKLNIRTMPKTRTLAKSDSVCVLFLFCFFFFFQSFNIYQCSQIVLQLI